MHLTPFSGFRRGRRWRQGTPRARERRDLSPPSDEGQASLPTLELERRLRRNFATVVTDRVLASTWRQTKKYEQKYSLMNAEVAAEGTEPEGNELSDCDVLDDGEDSDPPNEIEFDGPQR